MLLCSTEPLPELLPIGVPPMVLLVASSASASVHVTSLIRRATADHCWHRPFESPPFVLNPYHTARSATLHDTAHIAHRLGKRMLKRSASSFMCSLACGEEDSSTGMVDRQQGWVY